jgi:LacI family transcriptional regulator, galactose operon repressor
MSKRKVTAADVAEMAGVSKWTVIRAFKPDASISDGSRERVRKAADTVGYRPNLLARSLATHKTNQIAVLVDDFANPHKLPVLEALTLGLQAEGMVLMLININRQFDQIDALIHANQRQVDGIVLFANLLQDAILKEARSGKINAPLIILARESTIESIPSVTADASWSIKEIGSYLVKQGYRRPGFMIGPAAQGSLVSRYRFFKQFWQEQGILEMALMYAGSYDRHLGERALRKYLLETPREQRIDVLMCENDVLAFGALDVARSEFQLRVPEDLAVVGYDGIDLAGSQNYNLTTYEQPIAKMVDNTIGMLTGRVERASISLRGKLIVRGST